MNFKNLLWIVLALGAGAVFLWIVSGGIQPTASIVMQPQSQMELTPFDKKLALQLMDKDQDGKCDTCGMDVKLCLDSGQLECNMNSQSSIGVLGSQHTHANWKVFINGMPLDFSDKAHMERMRANLPVSSFIHVDSGAPAPEKTGDVLHMHATGVPLWVFFESLGMKFNNQCLEISAPEKYCTYAKDTLKFFVNGKPNSKWEKYVFQDEDKILISYGDETPTEIQGQLNAITSFAGQH